MEERLAELLEHTIQSLGCDLVQIKIGGSSHKTVEILIEKQDGTNIRVDECQKVSRNISAILDVEDVMSDKYYLEVSSAGLERPLIKSTDYIKFAGRDIKIRLKNPIDNKSSYVGKLLGIQNDQIALEADSVTWHFDHSNIKKAKLILTDEIFKALLNKKTKSAACNISKRTPTLIKEDKNETLEPI